MQFFIGQNDSPTHRSLVQELAQPGRDPAPQRGDLLRLSLFPRDARRESAHRSGDRLFDADSYFDAAQFGCNRLDRTKLLGLPLSLAGGDFQAGAKTWAGRSWRSPHFLADE